MRKWYRLCLLNQIFFQATCFLSKLGSAVGFIREVNLWSEQRNVVVRNLGFVIQCQGQKTARGAKRERRQMLVNIFRLLFKLLKMQGRLKSESLMSRERNNCLAQPKTSKTTKDPKLKDSLYCTDNCTTLFFVASQDHHEHWAARTFQIKKIVQSVRRDVWDKIWGILGGSSGDGHVQIHSVTDFRQSPKSPILIFKSPVIHHSSE